MSTKPPVTDERTQRRYMEDGWEVIEDVRSPDRPTGQEIIRRLRLRSANEERTVKVIYPSDADNKAYAATLNEFERKCLSCVHDPIVDERGELVGWKILYLKPGDVWVEEGGPGGPVRMLVNRKTGKKRRDHDSDDF